MFKRRGQAPSDLPRRYRWARDEIVRRRLENHDLQVENGRLRIELAKARGEDPLAVVFDHVKGEVRHGRK